MKKILIFALVALMLAVNVFAADAASPNTHQLPPPTSAAQQLKRIGLNITGLHTGNITTRI